MRSLAVLMTLALFPAFSPAEDDAAQPAKSPVPLQNTIDAVLKKVTPSVVHIWSADEEPRPRGTGVVVCKDGLIVTCAHAHKKGKVGDAVEVRFPGIPGKKAAPGKVLAKFEEWANYKQYDLALIQIDGKAEWPAIEIGSSGTLTNCDALLAVGFPAGRMYYGDYPCYIRLGYRREPADSLERKDLPTTILWFAGDSGGPLFDLTGSLVGVASHSRLVGTNMCYVPADALVQVWKELAGDRPLPRSSAVRPAVEPLSAATARGIRAVQPSVAEIRCDDQRWSLEKAADRRWSGVGAYVGDGFFVTKASELVLGREVTVVLRDNFLTWATVAATDSARDLALLKLGEIPPDGIAPIEWADAKNLPAGTVLAAVMPPGFTPPMGVVSVPAREVLPIPGSLPVKVQDAKGGVEITAIVELGRVQMYPWLALPQFPLRQGDVITHIAGVPVPNREEFVKLINNGASIGKHARVAGELVTVTYERQGTNEEATVHLRPMFSTPTQLFYPTSYRYSGFPVAIASDLNARPEHCGAPVVDAEGRVVGLLVARAMNIESFILPAGEVKASVEEMRMSATAGVKKAG